MLEEPGAGKPHARIRAGAVGQLAVLPRWRRVVVPRTPLTGVVIAVLMAAPTTADKGSGAKLRAGSARGTA